MDPADRDEGGTTKASRKAFVVRPRSHGVSSFHYVKFTATRLYLNALVLYYFNIFVLQKKERKK